jgi:DNA-binding transcriptional MerR regulator
MPRVGRDSGGRRVYEHEHVEHLVFLERMRRTGMSVAALRTLTELSMKGWRTLAERQDLLRAHRARVVEAIADLRAALYLIDAKIGYYAEWAAKKKRPGKDVRRTAGNRRRARA